MNKIKILFFLTFLLLPIMIFANENNTNTSIKMYKNFDEQKVFNIVKKIYHHSQDYLFDTSWDKLHITKRLTSGFLDIEIHVDNLLLSAQPSNETNTTKLELELFTTIGEIKKPITPDKFIYKLFWNRVEYASGFTNNWIDCRSFDAMLLSTHPLCTVSKELLIQ